MTDRELLEMAAKASGADVTFDIEGTAWRKWPSFKWNPLSDDGDAFRLAVKLGIGMEPEYKDEFGVMLSYASITTGGVFMEDHRDDRYAATRRAIVRAAAEMGKSTR